MSILQQAGKKCTGTICISTWHDVKHVIFSGLDFITRNTKANKIVWLFVKNLIFTIVVPGTVAVTIPVFVFSHESTQISPVSMAASLLLSIGGLIYFYCLRDIATIGRGTPAPIDPPRLLLLRGHYRFSRNPMYVGVLAVIFGWSLLFRSPYLVLYALAVATCFHLFVVFYEEPHLKRVFGPGYEQYCSRAGRWLWFRKPVVS